MKPNLFLVATILSFPVAADAAQCERQKSGYVEIIGDCIASPGGTWTMKARADTLIGNPGVDHISGGKLNDTVQAGGGDDLVSGGDGNDTLLGEGGGDTIEGDKGNDDLDGGSGHDTIDGGDGNDTLHGREGADKLTGGAGDDRLYGDLPSSNTTAGVFIGDDFVPANGTDVMTGTSGLDDFDLFAASGAGSNSLHAGGGADSVKAGIKPDNAWMEGGDDRVSDSNIGAADKWDGGKGFDTLDYSDSSTAVTIDLTGGKHVGPGGDSITGFESFVLTDRSDSIKVDYDVANGASPKVGGVPTYLLRILGYSSDSIHGDMIDVRGPRNPGTLPKASKGANILGTLGDDTVFSGDLADDILLDTGDDTAAAGGGNDTVVGGDGSDQLRGEGGKDILYGGKGSDTLVGGASADINDCGIAGVTSGGVPINDNATDRVAFEKVSDSPLSANDTVLNFHPKKDRIDLTRLDANGKVSGVQHFKLVAGLTGAAGELMVTYDPDPDLPSFSLYGNTKGAGVDFFVFVGVQPGNWSATKPASFILLKCRSGKQPACVAE